MTFFKVISKFQKKIQWKPIVEIAEKLESTSDSLDRYGKYKAS